MPMYKTEVSAEIASKIENSASELIADLHPDARLVLTAVVLRDGAKGRVLHAVLHQLGRVEQQREDFIGLLAELMSPRDDYAIDAACKRAKHARGCADWKTSGEQPEVLSVRWSGSEK